MSELYEKLGLFYLGKQVDKNGAPTGLLELIKSDDLTTHAAIIGMTGSGKTGLGIGLIEEATIDSIPSIVIDPKGDMGDLLLAFEDLDPKSFLPWIDPMEAKKAGISLEEYAKKIANRWKEGLMSFHQGPDRIRRLKSSADFAIYTPGSDAGIPISVLASFDPPTKEIQDDVDTYNHILSTTASSLLDLLEKEESESFVLLCNILDYHWRQEQSISLEQLIADIIAPPFKKIGVLDLESFYPKNRRMKLALDFNTLLANPSFALWMQGEPLDISKFFYTPEGKPRVNIITIAHLSQKERMFFITLFLGRLISWMRTQSGTSTLRALLYMDEIFGFFPPNANPPSKEPMLLLLKQARAYGLGIVLSTQNPVDLDYKGLSNIGTWFLGRLQTRQDIDRVIDGLQKANQQMDSKEIRALLSNLPKRTFLLRSIHKESIELFVTRWVLSYLKGPLSKEEIKRLMAPKRSHLTTPSSVASSNKREKTKESTPIVSAEIPQLFDILNPKPPFFFLPFLLVKANLHYLNSSRGIDLVKKEMCEIELDEQMQSVDLQDCEESENKPYATKAPKEADFSPVPPFLADSKEIRRIQKQIKDQLYTSRRLTIYKIQSLGIESSINESYEEFLARVQTLLREKKEIQREQIKERYAKKLERLHTQLDRAIQKLQKEKEEAKSKTTDTILSLGLTLLDSLFGRKKIKSSTISKAGSTISKAKKAYDEYDDIEIAKNRVEELESKLLQIQEELSQKLEELDERYSLDRYEIKEIYIKPRKSEIQVDLALLWRED